MDAVKWIEIVASGLAAAFWLISATRPLIGTLDGIVPSLVDIGHWNMAAAGLSCLAAGAHAASSFGRNPRRRSALR
jgi:hypothetical protein